MYLSRVRLERMITCFLAGMSVVCLLALASCQRNQSSQNSVSSPAPSQIVQKPASNPSGRQVINLAQLSSYRFAVVASVKSMEAVSKANKALQSAGIASYMVGSRHTYKIQVREQDRTRAIDILKTNSQANHYALALLP